MTPLHQTPSRRIGLLFVACARDVKGEPARRLTLHEVCYEKLLRDSIIRVYANLVQKLREYLISLCHGD